MSDIENETPYNPEHEIIQTIMMLRKGHSVFHTMEEPGPDTETVMVALTERDLWMVAMGIPLLNSTFLQSGVACFHEASRELQERLLELVRAQKPDWVGEA